MDMAIARPSGIGECWLQSMSLSWMCKDDKIYTGISFGVHLVP